MLLKPYVYTVLRDRIKEHRVFDAIKIPDSVKPYLPIHLRDATSLIHITYPLSAKGTVYDGTCRAETNTRFLFGATFSIARLHGPPETAIEDSDANDAGNAGGTGDAGGAGGAARRAKRRPSKAHTRSARKRPGYEDVSDEDGGSDMGAKSEVEDDSGAPRRRSTRVQQMVKSAAVVNSDDDAASDDEDEEEDVESVEDDEEKRGDESGMDVEEIDELDPDETNDNRPVTAGLEETDDEGNEDERMVDKALFSLAAIRLSQPAPSSALPSRAPTPALPNSVPAIISAPAQAPAITAPVDPPESPRVAPAPPVHGHPVPLVSAASPVLEAPRQDGGRAAVAPENSADLAAQSGSMRVDITNAFDGAGGAAGDASGTTASTSSVPRALPSRKRARNDGGDAPVVPKRAKTAAAPLQMRRQAAAAAAAASATAATATTSGAQDQVMDGDTDPAV